MDMGAYEADTRPSVLCFGSLNTDYVYRVARFARPGETIMSQERSVFCGGKGLNQSIALARAGARAFHVGAVGCDGGDALIERLERSGVDTRFVVRRDGPGGHTVIQVDEQGHNSILVYGGANRTIGEEDFARAISAFGDGDYAVIQNEINLVDEIMKRAKAHGMRIVLNPSPMDGGALWLPYELCDILVLNEKEATALLRARQPGGAPPAADEPFGKGAALAALFPGASVALTFGDEGAMLATPSGVYAQSAFEVEVVDTTAARDTFTGYLVASIASGLEPQAALKRACAAASISASRAGAEPSIPWTMDVDVFMQPRGETYG